VTVADGLEGIPSEGWAFLGVLVTQMVIVITLIINKRNHATTQRKLDVVEGHINNVEDDIDHDAQDVSIGQRLRRMETSMNIEFTENTRTHGLLADGLVRNAEELFKRATYIHEDIGAYILKLDESKPAGWYIFWVSPGYELISGLGLDAIEQGDYLDRIYPDDVEHVMASFKRSLDNEASWDVTYRQRGPNGWQVLHQQAEPYFGPNGEMVGRFGLLRVVNSNADLPLPTQGV